MLETFAKEILAAIDFKQLGMALVPIAILLYQNHCQRQDAKADKEDLRGLVNTYHSDLKENLETNHKLEQAIIILSERMR